MTFFDSGVLIGALLGTHPEHERCLAAIRHFRDGLTDAHALAETFSTLTGFYKVPIADAAELILDLRERFPIKPLHVVDYEDAIGQASQRGIMGGGIYDSLHATFARRHRALRIVTRNPSHFAHVAPEVEILTP